jgi:exosortase
MSSVLSQGAADVSASAGRPQSLRAHSLLAAACLLALVLWVYWDLLMQMAHRWSVDPEYSHGFLVPALAAYLLWFRRYLFVPKDWQSSWWSLAPLLCGLGMYLGGSYLYYSWIEQCSLPVVLAGVCLALGGKRCLQWTWPAAAFLFFMIPLPSRIGGMLAHPLQRIATISSANVLQTLGIFAQPDGNVIVLRDGELGIVEACSGLRMLVVFVALSTVVALIMQRSLLQRLLIVASAVPIALMCNVIRISLTGILYQSGGSQAAHLVFHDLAGWLMIPLALGFLVIELKFFAHLFVPPDPEDGPRSRAMMPRMSAPRSRTGLVDGPKPVVNPQG